MEVERFFDPQSMDLNTLYQQDVDLGVDWLNFEPVKSIKESQFEEQKKPVLDLSNFIIDGETGEYLPVPQNNSNQPQIQEKCAESGQNSQEFNIDDCLDFLQTSMNSANEEVYQAPQALNIGQGITDLSTIIQTTDSSSVSTNIWDDIATLSELTGMTFEGNTDNASPDPATESPNMQTQFQAVNQFQTMPQIQTQPADQQTPMKDQFFMGNQFPNFPTPPYNEQSESPNTYTSPPHMFPDGEGAFGTLEEANMTELLLSQQPDFFMGMDSAQMAPAPSSSGQVVSPGSYFFGGDEPNGNFQSDLTDLDIGNNVQNQAGPFLNPSTSPYVPPPIGDMDIGRITISESRDSDSGISLDGFNDSMTHMDIDMMEQDPIVKQENVMQSNRTFTAAEKQAEATLREERRASQRESRDLKKAREMGISLTLEQIINSPVEEYNELLARTPMTAAQQTLVRDIRRRGKNKVAAQNCRKRKIETISSMEIDIDELNMKRQSLVMKQKEIEATRKAIKNKYAQLYQKIFTSLRDESGRPYDSSRFALEQVEGAVILVPRVAKQRVDGNNNNTQNNGDRTVAFFDLSKVKIEKQEM